MISRTKGIFSSNLWKPKNIHSLEYLKYLYTVLIKNQNISEQNKELLVEVFRLIAEILIWGDQNDSSIIDFFLEKNISSLFLKFMNQKNGKLIYKQLLQTLSIIFENISDNTSIYYLLSNNHINAIICHKFDFADEEVMAYYISFLKALSMKLNKHTVNFFYNEHTNDFALFTEAIKFFNQSESMVRTAVRNITLNVYKVVDKAMLKYIIDKTAVPYFHSLMWFIGSRIIDMDGCIRTEIETQNNFSRLQSLVDEHLDHLHYINDILCLNVELLNDVLTNSLLNKLLIPLYIYSLSKRRPHSADTDPRPHVNYVISMFLLAQVFLIIKHQKVAQCLAKIILTGDLDMCVNDTFSSSTESDVTERKFDSPDVNLSETLDRIKGRPRSRELKSKTVEDSLPESDPQLSKSSPVSMTETVVCSAPVTPRHRYNSEIIVTDSSQTPTNINKTLSFTFKPQAAFSLTGKPFLKAIFRSLELDEGSQTDDYDTLFAMCLLFAMCQNQGVDEGLLISCGLTSKSLTKDDYNKPLMDKLIGIFNKAVKYGSPLRLVTLETACILVEILVCSRDRCWISDEHFAYILTAFEESKLLLRNYYKTEEIFVDMFEDEYMSLQKRPLNVEFLMMDSGILLPHTSVSVNITDFTKKLPTNDFERARYVIRVFLLLRQLCEKIRIEDNLKESGLDNSIVTYPFNPNVVAIAEKLDLTNRDLIACTIEYGGKSERRFLVVDEQQIIIVEPDSKRVGWGVVTFVGFLQHLKISAPRDDHKSLIINVYNHASAIALKCPILNSSKKPVPMLAAKFIFDDHIRCMVAQKRLEKGREMAHQLKLQQIALMLDFPTNVALSIKPSINNKGYRSGYFGPKESVQENRIAQSVLEKSNSVRISDDCSNGMKSTIHTITGSSSLSELHVDKTLFQ